MCRQQFLRGPDYINDKEMRESVNQYNLKNKGGKTEIRKDRTSKSPRNTTLPKPIINGLKEDESRKEEEE